VGGFDHGEHTGVMIANGIFSNLSQARLGTLEEDLGMEGTDYNLATSILFVGYLLMQLPSNLLLTRVRPSLFLGIAMALWYDCALSSSTFPMLIYLVGVLFQPAKQLSLHFRDLS
jgi:hypothetical protein